MSSYKSELKGYTQKGALNLKSKSRKQIVKVEKKKKSSYSAKSILRRWLEMFLLQNQNK